MHTPIVKGVIADADGLLFDTEGIFDRVVQEYALERIGRVIPEPHFSELRTRQFGKKKEESAQLLFDCLRAIEPTFSDDDYLRWRQPRLDELFCAVDLNPGASKLFCHLHSRNVPMAIATAANATDLERKIRPYRQFAGCFNAIITGDQVQHGKPAPDLFLLAADSLGLPLSECIVFEDALNGVQAAVVGGAALVIAVPVGHVDRTSFVSAGSNVVVLGSLLDFVPEEFGLPAFSDAASET